jgi:transposase-like protein
MGKHYSQLSLGERVKIELLLEQGATLRSIAAQLGRSPSTISREVRRNAQKTKQWDGSYEGERAEEGNVQMRGGNSPMKDRVGAGRSPPQRSPAPARSSALWAVIWRREVVIARFR